MAEYSLIVNIEVMPVADSGGMRGMRPHTLLTGLDAFL